MKYAPSMKKIPSFMRNSAPLSAPLDIAAGVPRDFLLRDLKEKRKFRLLSRKLTVFVTFVTVYLAVLLLDRNISGRTYSQSSFIPILRQSVVFTGSPSRLSCL